MSETVSGHAIGPNGEQGPMIRRTHYNAEETKEILEGIHKKMGQITPHTMTTPHTTLITMLEMMGLDVVEEVSFHPYTVDCYVPSLHLAFEADGPKHQKSKDMQRDLHLMATYALPVIRLTAKELANKTDGFFYMAKAVATMSLNADTAQERQQLAVSHGWKF